MSLAAKFRDLRARILPALAMAALAAGLFWYGGQVFSFAIAFLIGLLLFEWTSLCAEETGIGLLPRLLLIVGGAALVAGAPFMPAWAILTGLASLAVAFWGVNYRRIGRWTLPITVLIILAGIAAVELRASAPVLLLATALCIIGTDSGAYLAGKAIGGPKFWPAVSPNKTWAGIFGGIALSILLALMVTLFTKVPLQAALPFGLLVAISGFIGDFGESALKRHFGVKDSSSLLGAHGGAMDRFDGHTVALVCVGTIESLLGPGALMGA